MRPKYIVGAGDAEKTPAAASQDHLGEGWSQGHRAEGNMGGLDP